jgi:proline dehydrogenase
MALARRLFLWASTNAWLRERAMRAPFVKRSVARFMPGERVEDAIDAAKRLQKTGISAILTHLGENLARIEEAEEVFQHYLRILDLIPTAGLDAQISVKPTQLGYDQDVEVCFRYLTRLLDRAVAIGTLLWLDMEGSPYVDGTIALYNRLRERSPSVGLALQAYLYRTDKDLDALLSRGAAIRLVKGAYLESTAVAFAKKADVDRHYFHLASKLLRPGSMPPGSLVHLATHDIALQEQLRQLLADRQVPRTRYEFAMLYGIHSSRQRQLASSGVTMRCLISYGEFWFPWYMRRLAERPANVWFVVRNLFRG